MCMVFLLLGRRQPSVMLVPCAFQWSEIAVKPVLSAIDQVPINQLAEFGADIERGAYFSLAALTLFVIGYWLTSRSGTRNYTAMLESDVIHLSLASVVKLSISLIFLGSVFSVIAVRIPALEQILLALSLLSTCGIFILTYWCLKNGKAYGLLAAVMALEIITGFSGYFSTFRTPLLAFACAALSARPQIRLRDALILMMTITTIAILGSFWSYIKSDYRGVLSGGSMSQEVVVPVAVRAGFLAKEAATFDTRKLADGFQLLLSRHSYIDFISNTLQNVPYAVPFEKGARLQASVLHVVAPRILFQDKSSLESDTDVTIKYTGVNINTRGATSVSIGYLGELYIDFGQVVAVVVCGIGGALFGLGHRVLRGGPGPAIVRFAVCAAFALSFGAFEAALVKEIGSIVAAFVGLWLGQRYLLPRLFTLAISTARRPRSTPVLHTS